MISGVLGLGVGHKGKKKNSHTNFTPSEENAVGSVTNQGNGGSNKRRLDETGHTILPGTLLDAGSEEVLRQGWMKLATPVLPGTLLDAGSEEVLRQGWMKLATPSYLVLSLMQALRKY